MELRRLLKANALFSASSGALLVVGAAVLDAPLGVDYRMLVVVGIGLVGYGASLAGGADGDSAVSTARLAVAMDAAWVLGAVVLLAGFPTAMTTTGRLALGAVSLVVLFFATAQAGAMRESTTS